MLVIDRDRLAAQLETLARYSDAPPPAVTRILYSNTDLAARLYLKTLIAEVGLAVREDALGNLFARWQGADPTLAAVATGSHIDAIPHAGRFDGTVGVLGGLEAIRALKTSEFRPTRAIELLMFTAEEPTRFGVGCLGSRVLSGTLTPDEVRALRDDEGRSPETVAREVGFTGALETVALPVGHYHAFVELHIEQGPLLEQRHLPIGVVSAIAAPATLHVTLEGEGGHAGAVLMVGRRDALAAAAEVVLAAERTAKESGAPDTVATVGKLTVHPGAVNSIPSRVSLSVDVRDIDLAKRDHAVAEIERAIRTISGERKLKAVVTRVNADPPAVCDHAVIAAIEEAARAADLATLPMVSRAYHDTLFMARLGPVGMIFIPSKGGVSHRPDEFSSADDIALGATVLAHTLARLANN